MLLLNYVNMTVMLFAFLCSLYRYPLLDKASRLLCLHLGLAITAEMAGRMAVSRYHTNMPVYAIFSLLEFSIVACYFNCTIDVLRRSNAGIYLAVAGMLAGIANILFLQPVYVLNSYFLLFEGFTIIGLALFAFLRLFQHEGLRLHYCHHFWFPAVMSFYWIATLLNWGLYDYLSMTLQENIWMVNAFVIVINIICYASGACIFLAYPKMKNAYAS